MQDRTANRDPETHTPMIQKYLYKVTKVIYFQQAKQFNFTLNANYRSYNPI